MAARDPRLRPGRRRRSIWVGRLGSRVLGPAAVIAAALLAGGVAQPVGYAQSASELDRAKDLYVSAEAAMKDGRFDDAARDYGAAYELSKDPALFFKIGHAHERAGKCDTALIYYARYLREGKPTEQFVAVTKEHIAACGGDPQGAGSAPGARPGAGSGSAGSGSAGDAGSAAAGSAGEASGSAGTGAGSAGTDTAGTGSAGAGAGSAGAGSAGSGSAGAGGAGSGSTGSPQPVPPAGGATAPAGTELAAGATGTGSAVPIPTTQQKVAWIMSGSAVALVTLGGVLAYAASSSENDVRDLYAGFGGQEPTFDGATRKRYNDLVDQGHSYQHLSWAAFGLAGAAGIGAALLFTIGGSESAQHARVTPVIGPQGAGVTVRF
jgi:hypothetical protein